MFNLAHPIDQMSNLLQNILFKLLLLFLLLATNKAFNQSTETMMELNMKTFQLDDNNTKFKVNKNITFCLIENNTSNDSISIEYSANEVLNTAGLSKFTEIGQIMKDRTKNTTCFLPFKIEEKDYSQIIIKRYQKNKLIEERKLNYKNTGGIKFDVSGGFFWTGLRDEVYVLRINQKQQKPLLQKILVKEELDLAC